MSARKKKKKAKRRTDLIGRLGPPQNLRPAGAHEDRRKPKRQDVKIELQHEVIEDEER